MSMDRPLSAADEAEAHGDPRGQDGGMVGHHGITEAELVKLQRDVQAIREREAKEAKDNASGGR